jgi:hypothetical protein
MLIDMMKESTVRRRLSMKRDDSWKSRVDLQVDKLTRSERFSDEDRVEIKKYMRERYRAMHGCGCLCTLSRECKKGLIA